MYNTWCSGTALKKNLHVLFQHRSEHRERSAVANTHGFRKPPGQVKGTAAAHLSGEALRTVRWAPYTPKSCSKATSVWAQEKQVLVPVYPSDVTESHRTRGGAETLTLRRQGTHRLTSGWHRHSWDGPQVTAWHSPMGQGGVSVWGSFRVKSILRARQNWGAAPQLCPAPPTPQSSWGFHRGAPYLTHFGFPLPFRKVWSINKNLLSASAPEDSPYSVSFESSWIGFWALFLVPAPTKHRAGPPLVCPQPQDSCLASPLPPVASHPSSGWRATNLCILSWLVLAAPSPLLLLAMMSTHLFPFLTSSPDTQPGWPKEWHDTLWMKTKQHMKDILRRIWIFILPTRIPFLFWHF